jgi:hypothetical protein
MLELVMQKAISGQDTNPLPWVGVFLETGWLQVLHQVSKVKSSFPRLWCFFFSSCIEEGGAANSEAQKYIAMENLPREISQRPFLKL